MSNNLLEVKGIKKYYSSVDGAGVILPRMLVLDDVNFSVEDNDTQLITSILAPFTAGKSTLLKIIAALVPPDEGHILLRGNEYRDPAGSIVYIPERASSFPWYNVRENVSFGIRNQARSTDTLSNIISLVGLTGYEEHFPHNKSVGFRFRISLARALAVNPVIVLLDDCFKAMDQETKEEIYTLIKDISSNLKIPFIVSTTNIHEAIFLSHTIFLMKKNPGSIFKQIQNDPGSLVDFAINNNVITMRNDIEEYFRSVSEGGTVNFSI